ncbi:hypothetical protein AB1Y20_005524 [Prymnesium parvum]|uniref:Protein kinase domain-containing protein n=1 Tax=Prymnesium parvum TaxID=97485 RepID=A0AB34J4H4_PRYPA
MPHTPPRQKETMHRAQRDSTASLVDLASRCELDEREDVRLAHQSSGMLRLKSKPSDLDLEGLSRASAPPAKKRAVSIPWSDLKKVRYVAEGAHCTVHLAELNDNPIAVKLLKQEHLGDPVVTRDLEVETELLLGMSHKHVIKLFGSGSVQGCNFLVLERLQTTLAQKYVNQVKVPLFSRASRKQSASFNTTLVVAEQLAQAMVYIHDDAFPEHQLLHRDLKPDNIGFAFDGRLVLFDFGLAKLIPRPTAKIPHPVDMTGKTGSARYMAPEIALSRPYNGAADVYSFSMILWATAAHKKPFNGMDLEGLYSRVIYGDERPSCSATWPAAFNSLLADCWSPMAKDRPTFAQVLERIRAMLKQ